jgi:hypothetical protein
MNTIMRKIAQTDEIPHSSRISAIVCSLMSLVEDLRSDRTALLGLILITPLKKGGKEVIGGGRSSFTLLTRR